MAEFIFDDGTPLSDPDLNAGMKGGVPRGHRQPVGFYASIPPSQIDLIPRGEWSDLIKDGEANKSFLSHIRLRGNQGNPIPSLDQDGQAYCWNYGPVGGVIVSRAKANLPYVRLSAHAGACKIKNFRSEGGWGALSLDFLIKNGCPSVEKWPEKSMARQHDNEETWKEAALYKPDETFMDVASPVYNRDLTFDQVMTLLLRRIPVIGDFNWWGHCVCILDPVEVSKGQFGVRIWNSWTDSWSDRGMGVLTGSKAIPDNAVAIATVSA